MLSTFIEHYLNTSKVYLPPTLSILVKQLSTYIFIATSIQSISKTDERKSEIVRQVLMKSLKATNIFKVYATLTLQYHRIIEVSKGILKEQDLKFQRTDQVKVGTVFLYHYLEGRKHFVRSEVFLYEGVRVGNFICCLAHSCEISALLSFFLSNFHELEELCSYLICILVGTFF